jgi:hypothetical protein
VSNHEKAKMGTLAVSTGCIDLCSNDPALMRRLDIEKY